MEVTIRDVAARANVSFQLVSAVLGKKSYARASAKTREKIDQAARELGYQPNISARILQGGKSGLLGVLIDSRPPEESHSLLAEIEQAASAQGYRLLIAQAHNEPEKLLQSYYSLKQNGVDGVISLANDYPFADCRLDEVLKAERKLIFVRDTADGSYSSVDIDVAGGMIQAAEHLQKQGYERTALLLVDNDAEKSCLNRSMQQRIEGFKSACPEGKVCFLRCNDTDIDRIETQCELFIENELRPASIDSVIVQNDYYGAVLMNRLAKANIRVPEDCGIIGQDNRRICECLGVKLTSLDYDRRALAEKVVEFMLKHINGEAETCRKVFEMKLIVRESSVKNINNSKES